MKSTTDLIKELAKNPSPVPKDPAIQRIVERGTEAVIHLHSALASSSDYIRAGAAQALGEIGDRRVIIPLTRALEDPIATVRWSAARALGKIGGPDAVRALKQALLAADRCVQQIAHDEMVRIAWKTECPDDDREPY